MATIDVEAPAENEAELAAAFAALLDEVFQAKSANLTALAAISATAYGRSLLALADATALANEVRDILAAGAPGVLDTLDEIAAALNDDANFAATMVTALAGKQPLDADLTAIAALTTQAFGRSLLTAPDAATAREAIGAATTAIVNRIVEGVGWAYTGSLGFALSAGQVYVDDDLVNVAAQTLTLNAADATNPRVDVLYVDNTGTFGKLTGTPSASPSPPSVDPTTQFYLTFVLVPAAATDLTAGITTEVIYDENTEWTASVSGTGFNINSTNNPNTGTKCVEGTTVAPGAYAKFVDGTPTAFGDAGNILLSIRSKGVWNAKRSLVLQLYLSGVPIGQPVTLKEGSFGFDSSNTSSYQLLVIPKTQFAVAAATAPTEFRITAAGSGGTAIGFYIDPIKIQSPSSSTAGGGQSSGMTQTQADARYVKRLGVDSITGTTFTLSAADIGNHRRFTNAAAIAMTVNASHGFAVGDRVRFTQAGAGQVTMAGSGVTLNSRGGALKSNGQYAVWELECVGATTFDVLGDVTV